jgi:23S rRNA pseudouridine1911/1915/1917 synthase
LKITLNKQTTLLQLLQEEYKESPRTRIKKMLQNGSVKCNGKVVTLHSFRLKPGDEVEISSNTGAIAKSSLPFTVLYEDQHIIAIDKPAGIATSSTDNSPSVHHTLIQHLKQISGGRIRSYVVHRLDREVSGVLLFAKNKGIMNIIKDNWKDTEKFYYALVEGIPEKPFGTIESWLVEDKALKVHSTDQQEGAKYSITHYKTVRTTNNYTLLEVSLETGRKNQIRVHLSDIGCPIVGDRKYGATSEFIRRVRLHAFYLSIPHPITGEKIIIESPMPDNFLKLKNKNEVYK